MDQVKKKKIPKYYKGMLLRHNKYNFVIQLMDKQRSTKWIFEVVEGELHPSLKPDIIFDLDLNLYNIYSYDTIRTSFTPITNSTAGRILYGT